MVSIVLTFVFVIVGIVLAFIATVIIPELRDKRKCYYLTVTSKEEEQSSMHCYKVKKRNMFYEGVKIDCMVFYCKGYKFVIPKNQILSVEVSVPITTDPQCRFLKSLRKLPFASLFVKYKL